MVLTRAMVPHQILLVDDDPDHEEFLCSAIRATRLPIRVETRDPDRCLSRLHEGTSPELVLIDLAKDTLGGRVLVEKIREDDTLRHLPLLVLTDEDDPDHLHDLYQSQATVCLRRPMSLAEYRDLVRSIHVFWFKQAILCPDLYPNGRAIGSST